MSTLEKIIAYFKENEDAFNDCIEELDNYNGYLADDRYYPMEDLNEIYYHGKDVIEILSRAFYGYDENNWIIDNYGEKHHAEFNPNREFFRYNGYGNLVSSDYKDYSDHIDEYAIKSMSENRQWIETIDNEPELSELFDELEETEE